jgi:hypothetical protein
MRYVDDRNKNKHTFDDIDICRIYSVGFESSCETWHSEFRSLNNPQSVAFILLTSNIQGSN